MLLKNFDQRFLYPLHVWHKFGRLFPILDSNRSQRLGRRSHSSATVCTCTDGALFFVADFIAHRPRPVRLGGDAWAATSTWHGRAPPQSLTSPRRSTRMDASDRFACDVAIPWTRAYVRYVPMCFDRPGVLKLSLPHLLYCPSSPRSSSPCKLKHPLSNCSRKLFDSNRTQGSVATHMQE